MLVGEPWNSGVIGEEGKEIIYIERERAAGRG